MTVASHTRAPASRPIGKEAELDMDVIEPKSSATPVAPAAVPAAEQAPAAPEIAELRRRILERIIEISQPVPPPGSWSRFRSHNYVRCFSREPTELLSQLGQH